MAILKHCRLLFLENISIFVEVATLMLDLILLSNSKLTSADDNQKEKNVLINKNSTC